MKKKQKNSTKKLSLLNELQIFLRKNLFSASLTVVATVLMVLSPYILSYAQYGYYYLKCGKKPVMVSSFFGPKTYTPPSDKIGYKVSPLSIFFIRYTCEVPAQINQKTLKY